MPSAKPMTKSPPSWVSVIQAGQSSIALPKDGDPKAIHFPHAAGARLLDFSFSGLKTAVLYHVRGVPRRGQDVKSEPVRKLDEQEIADIAASFQAACIDVIVEKLRRAATRLPGVRSSSAGASLSQ